MLRQNDRCLSNHAASMTSTGGKAQSHALSFTHALAPTQHAAVSKQMAYAQHLCSHCPLSTSCIMRPYRAAQKQHLLVEAPLQNSGTAAYPLSAIRNSVSRSTVRQCRAKHVCCRPSWDRLTELQNVWQASCDVVCCQASR